MTIKDLSINDFFKTHSGAIFQKVSIRLKGMRKNQIMIKKLTTGALYTEKEFEDLLIEPIVIDNLKSLDYD